MNAIDPTGKDIWTLDSEGRLIDSQSFDMFDLILVYDKTNILKGSWKGDYGSITNQSSRESKTGTAYSVYEAKNDDIGTSVFEFLTQKTSVEWSQFKLGIDENNSNILTTSHDTNYDRGAAEIVEYNLLPNTIREWTHNHPQNTPYPSGLNNSDINGDIPFARKIERMNTIQARFRIFLPGIKKYVEFTTGASVFDSEYDSFFNILPPFDVVAHKKI